MARGKAQNETTDSTYISPPYFKQQVCDKAIEKGYTCFLENSVIMFPYCITNEKCNEIEQWLMNTYGEEQEISQGGKRKTIKQIPFSYGFCGTR